MKVFLPALIIFGATIIVGGPARTADIAIGLTDDVIDVDAGFSGAKVVLFGALSGVDAAALETDAAIDIIAVVRGPQTTFQMRPLQQDGMIWVAGPPIRIKAPGILLTNATRPVDEIAPLATRRELMINADADTVAATMRPIGENAAVYVGKTGARAVSAEFIADATRAGRIRETAGSVAFKKGSLFSINVDLPPTTPVGHYHVDVYLFREGALISQDSAALSVGKVGLERNIYELANERPVAYGIGCVVISLLAGWLAAAAFRK